MKLDDLMKTIAILGFSIIALSAVAVPLQVVSQRNNAAAPSASGGGNSMMPVIGGNGRYVLFASSANNLAITSSNTPYKKQELRSTFFSAIARAIPPRWSASI